MTDRRPGDDERTPDTERPVTQDEVHALREEARQEMGELRTDWAERQAAYDRADAGSVSGVQRSLLQDAARRFAGNKAAMAGLILIVAYVLLAIIVPLTQPHSNATQFAFENAQRGASWKHPFGFDPKGRDLWLRSWLGARISLSIAGVVALVILAVGVTYGSVSGFIGGWVDSAMMRFLDALYGLPYLPFAIITVSVFRKHFPDAPPIAYMVPALSITAWFTSARIMRGQMLSLKENEYVASALASGAKATRVITRHVIPNTIGVMIVVIFLEIPNAILSEAFLSFLSLGVQPPDPSWGVLAQDGYTFIDAEPHLVWVPALLIATTVLGAIAIADGLRDALDPRGQEH
jgi:oligopeptide transport system permease protein